MENTYGSAMTGQMMVVEKGAAVKGELQSASCPSFSWNSLHRRGRHKVRLETPADSVISISAYTNTD